MRLARCGGRTQPRAPRGFDVRRTPHACAMSSGGGSRVRPGMTRITADISVSLDGFVTGPGPGLDNGLGTGGETLHPWAFSERPRRPPSPARSDSPLRCRRPRPSALRRGRRAERLGRRNRLRCWRGRRAGVPRRDELATGVGAAHPSCLDVRHHRAARRRHRRARACRGGVVGQRKGVPIPPEPERPCSPCSPAGTMAMPLPAARSVRGCGARRIDPVEFPIKVTPARAVPTLPDEQWSSSGPAARPDRRLRHFEP